MKVVIGDLHGHYREFNTLYHKIINEWKFNPDIDQMIFLGDYIDGGYDTDQLVSKLIWMANRYPHWVFLMGNHESMLINGIDKAHYSNEFELWWQQGGRATSFSYVPDDQLSKYMNRHATSFMKVEHIEWYKSLPRYYEDEQYIYVHAGLNPKVWKTKPGLENQDPTDLLWIRDPFIQSPRDYGKKVIFGHTTFPSPLVQPNKIGIDSMFHNKGMITAIRLPEEDFLYSDSVTEQRPSWDRDFLEQMGRLGWF